MGISSTELSDKILSDLKLYHYIKAGDFRVTFTDALPQEA